MSDKKTIGELVPYGDGYLLVVPKWVTDQLRGLKDGRTEESRLAEQLRSRLHRKSGRGPDNEVDR